MTIFDPSFLALPFFDGTHRKLAEQLEDWVEQNSVAPNAFAEGDLEEHARRIARRLGDAGWLNYAVGLAAEAPNAAQEFRSLCLIRMALAYCHDLYDYVFSMQSLAAYPISRFGTSEQKARWLRPMREGRVLGALAISEPQSGSNVVGIALRAREDGSGFALSGQKAWIGNGAIADFHTVLAKHAAGPPAFSMSLFLVPSETRGIRAHRISLLAPRPIANLDFEDCRVPTDALVGERGHGYRYVLEVLEKYRITVAAAAAGFSRRALRETTAHARSRKIGDGALLDLQMTKDRLATMQMDLDASLLFWARAAWAVDTGQTTAVARHTSAAKFVATEAAQRVVDSAVQLFGAAGLVVGSWPEALYRQIRLLRIYEGTSEVQKLVIASSI